MRISDWSSDVCSSDLQHQLTTRSFQRIHQAQHAYRFVHDDGVAQARQAYGAVSDEVGNHFLGAPDAYHFRSEEHTSELQSLMRISYAVFCLQKKKRHRQESILRQ